jgi:hypothetical protein
LLTTCRVAQLGSADAKLAGSLSLARAVSEQAGKIVRVYGVAQEKRTGHMEEN